MHNVYSVGEITVFIKISQERNNASKTYDQHGQRSRLNEFQRQPRLQCEHRNSQQQKPHKEKGEELKVIIARRSGDKESNLSGKLFLQFYIDARTGLIYQALHGHHIYYRGSV